MILQQIRIGGDRNFAYLLADEHSRRAIAFDVGSSHGLVHEMILGMGLTLQSIIVTHSHHDHLTAVEDLQLLAPAPLLMHESFPLADVPLTDGQTLHLGPITLKIIHCPGHAPDSIAIQINETHLITGDELFVSKIGGTRTEEQARTQYDSLHKKLLILSDHLIILPGHDYGPTPTSTLAREKQTNPFLLQLDFPAFLRLKTQWAEYKKSHGVV